MCGTQDAATYHCACKKVNKYLQTTRRELLIGADTGFVKGRGGGGGGGGYILDAAGDSA